jgi:hypothetical protein
MTREDLVERFSGALGAAGERRLEDVLLLLLAGQGTDSNVLSNIVNVMLVTKLIGGKTRGIESALLATLLLGPSQQQSAGASGSQPLLSGNMLPLLLAFGLLGEEEKAAAPEVVEKRRA